MRPSAPYLFFYLSNARRFYLSMGKLCSLMGFKLMANKLINSMKVASGCIQNVRVKMLNFQSCKTTVIAFQHPPGLP
jgi:hypothetical protein